MKMKSCKVRLDQIADADNLREAFLRAARGKGHHGEVIAFRENLAAELAALRAGILAGTVVVGQFTAFTIHEPKERRIHAPCFRERVLHHAVIGPCEADFERWLIEDTFACRRGKGREAALRRAEHHTARHGWFLKLDVAKYFDSIPHAVLLGEIARRWRDRRVVALWERIVRCYETAPGRGLPIGALTSQHLANFFLGAADRYVKETLRVPGYARYMDDMALWGGRAGGAEGGGARAEDLPGGAAGADAEGKLASPTGGARDEFSRLPGFPGRQPVGAAIAPAFPAALELVRAGARVRRYRRAGGAAPCAGAYGLRARGAV